MDFIRTSEGNKPLCPSLPQLTPCSTKLAGAKPEHFAGAFLGVEPEKAQVRIARFQHCPAAADLAEQAAVFAQMAADVLDDARDDGDSVGAPVERDRRLVPAFRRQ